MARTIFVVGGTGGTGSHVVKKLLARGEQVRLLVRDPGKAHSLFAGATVGQNQLAVVEGDVRRRETIGPVLSGAEAVICATGSRVPMGGNAPKQVDFEGVRNLVNASETQGVYRFLLVSSISVTKPNHPLNAFGRVLTWKFRGEEELRSSSLTYTIVRPGGLTDAPGGRAMLKVDQGDRMMGTISREDVAETIVQALDRPATFRVTFEVLALDRQGPVEDWDALFAPLVPDNIFNG